MSAHLGVQIASYLLARSTIQTAVVMSAGLGTKMGKAGKTYRHAACELQLGALRLDKPLLDMKLVEVYESESGSPYKKEFNSWFKKVRASHEDFFRDRKDLKVDLVLTPIDGAKALLSGESGSVSVAAAAARGTDEEPSFCDPYENCDPCEKATGYLVIAVGPEHAHTMENIDKELDITAKSLTDYEHHFSLLERILHHAPAKCRQVLGVMFDAYEDFKPQLPDMQCIRHLRGSAVAAGLAAFDGKLPWSIFFSRLPQVMQASIAAIGLKGHLYAIPLRDESEIKPDPTSKKQVAEVTASTSGQNKKPKKVYIGFNHVKVLRGNEGKVFRETDFVKSKNAVVSCSSISEVCVLDRVRFGSNGIAVSDTLTVSLVSGRATRQTDVVHLDKYMCCPHGTEVEGQDLIDAYRRYLLNTDRNASVLEAVNQLKLEKKEAEESKLKKEQLSGAIDGFG